MEELEFGEVIITTGRHKGRIGCYDDDDTEKTAIVYFGNITSVSGYFLIRKSYLRYPTIDDIATRIRDLEQITSELSFQATGSRPTTEKLIRLLRELDYAKEALWDRYNTGITSVSPNKPHIFSSHSSKDKPIVRKIVHDLKNLGFNCWLDEIDIAPGDSIVEKIQEGIEKSSYLVLFLSKNSVESEWVKREWNSRLSEQIEQKKVKIIPALLEDCKIPYLLRDIKYCDFREDYNTGFYSLKLAIETREKALEEPEE
ncbi:toll/interleukin-1 receptor domain-containing protein [Inquilinus sp.]|uniref:toll/interleukin-1 receptor domain-containing protein n=1 Tax=Inquilinus sp. TaxID=1932117 RepID=UPI0031DDC008